MRGRQELPSHTSPLCDTANLTTASVSTDLALEKFTIQVAIIEAFAVTVTVELAVDWQKPSLGQFVALAAETASAGMR